VSLILREWNKNDFDTIRNILEKTWFDTYSEIIPLDELKSYLYLTCSDDKLKTLINDPLVNGIIAEMNKIAVGWMRTSIDKSLNKYFINQLYILKEYQGIGIGKKLMKVAEEKAIKNKFDEIWLGVMSENILSVNWYKSLGFIFEKEEPFKMISTSVKHLIGFKKLL
jgi:ribosomal protein S18 acetylase RimI-like enzyme